MPLPDGCRMIRLNPILHVASAIRKDALYSINDLAIILDLKSQFSGCIWKSGYEKGTLKGELFNDSLPYFEKLITNGDLIGIYSSGSIQAQKLLLEYSQHGNIAKLFRQRFHKLHFKNNKYS